jgi:hypothetical protein
MLDAMKDPTASKMGRKGGKARARNLTPEERKLAARLAAQARWKQHRESRKAERLPMPIAAQAQASL